MKESEHFEQSEYAHPRTRIVFRFKLQIFDVDKKKKKIFMETF